MYDRNNGSLGTNNNKLLCVILSIIALLIVIVGTTLWIIYVANVKASEHDMTRMISQPSHTETLSGKHRCV
jgi:hypothetical protein